LAKKLVIVESPAKAKTISKYLGSDFEVLASVGHIRDLAEPKELPADKKKGALAKFSIDVDNDFQPFYTISAGKSKTVSELKSALKGAEELYLATDEDREGEAIAWHLLEVLKPKVPVHRMVFNEITKEAIQEAVANTRKINDNLVEAQETRRVVDRLVGYEISPVLWRKINRGLSAGRVQSPAMRMIVERERERIAFKAANYSSITAQLSQDAVEFEAKLASISGVKLAGSKSFDENGTLVQEVRVLSPDEAEELAKSLVGATLKVSSVEANQPPASHMLPSLPPPCSRRPPASWA
jgi:DNA topoisomerase I